MSADAGASLFTHRIRDLIARPALTCAPAATVRDAADQMAHARAGSIVVVDQDGAAVGIVTDRDLRTRVVAMGRNPETTPTADVMSSPVVDVDPQRFAFDALLEMTRRNIHHLVATEAGRVVGVVSSHDLSMLGTTHPVLLAREIDGAPSVDALTALARRVTAVVRRLVHDGGSAYDVGQVVAELNDRLVARALDLTALALQDLGLRAPAEPFCWLTFGSEARLEQTLRTDQDNGLVYADPPAEVAEATATYYRRFGVEAIEALVRIGFPRCPGDAMASNTRWCQPLSVWTGYFRHWMDHPAPAEVLAACIYFDLRPLTPDSRLGQALRSVIAEEAPGQKVFLGLLARDVVDRRVPLTLLGNVSVMRSGPNAGTVDVKGGGALQLVGAARVQALELGHPATNTVDRFRAAAGAGRYTAAEERDITDAYQHLLRLRLVHQLAQLDEGLAPDNRITVRQLSRADALLLRDALRTVKLVQAGLRERHATDLMG
jgi:CBS domain-containing protein